MRASQVAILALLSGCEQIFPAEEARRGARPDPAAAATDACAPEPVVSRPVAGCARDLPTRDVLQLPPLAPSAGSVVVYVDEGADPTTWAASTIYLTRDAEASTSFELALELFSIDWGALQGDLRLAPLADVPDGVEVREDRVWFDLTRLSEDALILELAGEIVLSEASRGCSPELPASFPVQIALSVEIVEPVWRFSNAWSWSIPPESCDVAPLVQIDHALDMQLFASEGQPLNLRRPSVRFTGEARGRISGEASDEPSQICFHGEGAVSVEAAGASARVEIVPTSEIDGADLSFFVPAGRVGVTLEEGETYDGAGALSDHVFPFVEGLWRGAQPLCSAPDPADFEVRSHTPQTCALSTPEHTPSGSGTSPGRWLELPVHVIADGRCDLEIDAPAMGGSDGIGHAISVWFENTDAMWSSDR